MIYTIDNFPYSEYRKIPVQKRKRGNPRTRQKIDYLDTIAAFDIEATNDAIIDHAYMYIWQMQIGEWTITGRTWDEWLKFLDRLMDNMDSARLMIFVHNLSYEFQFMRGVYPFQPDEVFAVDRRKVLKCSMYDMFEFRCSYLQSNMSLSMFTSKMGVENLKLSGEDFDYKKQRYPWTELSEQELEYCVNDVKGLVQAMKKQMELDDDNLYSLPFTSTGYVRRDVKRAMRHYNRTELKNQLPDYEVFKMLREAFRGGNTHANRYYVDEIVENVSSWDRVSSYPDVQLNRRFPLSPWLREKPEKLTIRQVKRRLDEHKRACLMRVCLWDVKLTDQMYGAPYIPVHKCRNLRGGERDNGRVLSADYLEITLTDIDFRIVLQQYDFSEIRFDDFYHSRYGLLPKQLRVTVQNYFKSKTELKGVEGQELYYMKSKNKLNSIYGMSVQSPVKQSIDYMDNEFIERCEDEAELLSESNKRAFQNYAWGVWVTAWARWELEQAIRLCGDQFLYCDTDSVKFFGDVDFTGYNDDHKKLSASNGACATDPKGNEHYLGVYEHDGTYKRFITMGAKKYGYEDEAGNLHITIAGVNKIKGAAELGRLENFKEGFCFKKAGGTESIYNDIPYSESMEIIREGRSISVTSNVCIRDSEYTLGVTGEYKRIIEDAKIWRELFKIC